MVWWGIMSDMNFDGEPSDSTLTEDLINLFPIQQKQRHVNVLWQNVEY